MNYEDLEDLEEALRDPEDAIYYGLCLSYKEPDFYCSYKNKPIRLTKRLFDSLYTMAEDTSKYHKFTVDKTGNGTAPDNDRKIIHRIRQEFKKVGFEADFIKSKAHYGYKIDSKILPYYLILLSGNKF